MEAFDDSARETAGAGGPRERHAATPNWQELLQVAHREQTALARPADLGQRVAPGPEARHRPYLPDGCRRPGALVLGHEPRRDPPSNSAR